jgi:hypothetical protein
MSNKLKISRWVGEALMALAVTAISLIVLQFAMVAG